MLIMFYLKDLIGERAKFEKELNESIAQNLKLNDKIKELERKCAEATSNMYDAKEKVNLTRLILCK